MERNMEKHKHKHIWFEHQEFGSKGVEHILVCHICRAKRDKPKNWKPKPMKESKLRVGAGKITIRSGSYVEY